MNILAQDLVIEQVKELINKEHLTQAEISRQSGVSQQVLSPLLKGTYTGSTGAYLERLANWLNTYKSAKATRAHSFTDPEWVQTYTANKIEKLMQTAQALVVWTMVYEGAGVGKTVTAKRYQSKNSNVWIITASPYIKGKKAFLTTLARELNITVGTMTIDRLAYEIQQKIEDSNGLIVVDEAQYVTDDVLNGLRILTENRVGVTLLGNDIVRARMSAPKSRSNMNPIWSRIMVSKRIRNSTQKDIEVYLKAWGIKDSELIKWAFKVIPTTTGQLRTLKNLIKLASAYAVQEDSQIKLSHIEKAYEAIKEVG
ncbi:AAA family ATPase [Photobacterium damselae]|uniref:AAA family ATPase n=1 Tax=Photobacterium damselae TaxID=38293 RepID=UPI00406860EF